MSRKASATASPPISSRTGASSSSTNDAGAPAFEAA